jgi:hypothetical protein
MLNRAKYGYAPDRGTPLIRLEDKDSVRWAGIVASIGRGGQTLELFTDMAKDQLSKYMTQGKRFDVCSPAWDVKQPYKKRVVGKAVLKSLDQKIVLTMVSYSPGWSIDAIQNGFDIYVAAKEDDEKDD